MRIGNGAEERRSALHDLLDRIVIRQTDHEDAYRRIFSHEAFLRKWFADRAGWRLLKGPGVYRLERLPSQAVPERGLPRLRTPQDYACLCWILWFAERQAVSARDWFVISELAAEVMQVAGERFSLAQRGHREALVRALNLLVDLGILLDTDGDAEAWAATAGTQVELVEVLYEFAPDAPRLLANFDPAGLGPLTAAVPGQLILPATGETAPPLARAWRALLLGPALWRPDDPEAFAALQAAAAAVRTDLQELLGWQLELTATCARIWRLTTARQAGAVLIDLLPDAGADAAGRHITYVYHPVLLLLQAVRLRIEGGELASDPDGAVALSGDDLRGIVMDLYRTCRRNWGAELGEQLSLADVTGRVLRQMRMMGYLRGPDAMDRCLLLPAAARFVGAYVGPLPTGRDAGREAAPAAAAGNQRPALRQLSFREQESGHADELDRA